MLTNSINSTTQSALETIWFPCSQMKDYESLPPLAINHAKGSYLYLEDGRSVIDAISSWWCKSMGHQHPAIKQAITEQINQFEHIIGTNTTSQALTTLSQKLTQLMPHLSKVFYAGDGSCAVEVAMKMSIHSRKILGQTQRTHFISLANSYHGETLATLSVSDVGLYKNPYHDLCFEATHLTSIPYVNHNSDPLWSDASDAWQQVETQLDAVKEKATAIIVEPILQGAGGMNIYSADFLKRLADYAKAHDIHLICDEIMTGFGRTGKTLACQYANIKPDFICLSKALTGGTLAMSAVLTSDPIYQLFYDDYETGKAFLHSNTYGGNALAAAVANAALQIHQDEALNQQALIIGEHMRQAMLSIAEQTQCLENVRQIGALCAADLTLNTKRAGFELFKIAMQKGAFLRPLGNTVYWLPPLNTSLETINQLSAITEECIWALKKQSL